jgi:hypothetical protein
LLGGGMGALGGAGEAVSRGADAGGIAGAATTGALLGGATGGALHGVLGPRAADLSQPGQRAAAYAESELGTPIPKGLAYGGPVSRWATGGVTKAHLPFSRRIRRLSEAAAEAGGERAEDIGARMRGGAAPERAISDIAARQGLQGIIDRNEDKINQGYNAWRAATDQGRAMPMPRLDAAVKDLIARRTRQHWRDPEIGLDQFQRAARGTDLESAHAIRASTRKLGKPGQEHPGYDAGEYRRLTGAMTQDIRDMTQATARTNPTDALAKFEQAEANMRGLASENETLQHLADAGGETSITQLMRAATERHGNLALLRRLDPKTKQLVGGQLLHELGYNPDTKKFSIEQFGRGWNQISNGAKSTLFNSTHVNDLNELANLGKVLKPGLAKETHGAHDVTPLIWMDIVDDATRAGAALGAGKATMLGTIGGAAGAAPGLLYAHWLSSPATTAAMSAWSKAYRGLAYGQRTPARIAMFNLATRNLSNQIGLPAQQIIQRALMHSPEAEDNQPNH